MSAPPKVTVIVPASGQASGQAGIEPNQISGFYPDTGASGGHGHHQHGHKHHHRNEPSPARPVVHHSRVSLSPVPGHHHQRSGSATHSRRQIRQTSELDNIYRAQAASICRAFQDKDYDSLDRQTKGALDNARLPSHYRKLYEEFRDFMSRERGAIRAGQLRDDAGGAEDLALYMINALHVKAKRHRHHMTDDMREVAHQTKRLKNIPSQRRREERHRMYAELDRLRTEEDARIRDGRARGRRSHNGSSSSSRSSSSSSSDSSCDECQKAKAARRAGRKQPYQQGQSGVVYAAPPQRDTTIKGAAAEYVAGKAAEEAEEEAVKKEIKDVQGSDKPGVAIERRVSQ